MSRLIDRAAGALAGPAYSSWIARSGWRLVPLMAAILSLDHSPMQRAWERTEAWVTPLSWLPDAWIFSPALTALAQITFMIAAALWVAGRGTPASSWTAAIAFTAFVSLYHERRIYIDHVFQCINIALLILALRSHTSSRRGARAGVEGELTMPRWVPISIAAFLGLFYTMGGLAKLVDSGLSWPNGLSLQLWAQLWGIPESPLTELVLSSRTLAATLQWVTLVAETAALPALLHRYTRWAVGLTLIGFHIGQQLLFGWQFYGNMLLLALFYLPLHEALAAPPRHRAP